MNFHKSSMSICKQDTNEREMDKLVQLVARRSCSNRIQDVSNCVIELKDSFVCLLKCCAKQLFS